MAFTAVELVLDYGNAQTGFGETSFGEAGSGAATNDDDVEGCFGERGGMVALRMDIDASGRHVELTDKIKWKSKAGAQVDNSNKSSNIYEIRIRSRLVGNINPFTWQLLPVLLGSFSLSVTSATLDI